MATNFPTSLDSLTNPTTGNPLSSPSHAGQHADANDAIEALEAKVGVNGSAVTTSHDYKIAALEANNSVTNARLRDSVALSVIGRSANSTGDPADIAAGTDGHVLRRAGTALGFGTVATAGIASNAVTNTVLRDSAGLSVIGRSASTAGDPADITAGTDGHVLRRSGTALGFGTVATAGIASNAVTNTVLRDSAGLSVIGRSASTTGDPADITAATDGHVLRRSGTTLGFGQVATAGIANNAVTGEKLAQGYTYVQTLYFISSGTFTKASYPWLRALRVTVCGGGGAGGGGAAATNGGGWASAGSGGAAAGVGIKLVTNIAGLSASETITVASGGAGVTGNSTGNAGGNSSAFGVTANGGAGGGGMAQTNVAAAASQSAGAGATGADISFNGGTGSCGVVLPTLAYIAPGQGGSTIFGQGGQTGPLVSAAAFGGTVVGPNYGTGGTGSYATNTVVGPTSGAGAQGIVIVELYA